MSFLHCKIWLKKKDFARIRIFHNTLLVWNFPVSLWLDGCVAKKNRSFVSSHDNSGQGTSHEWKEGMVLQCV